MRSMMSLLLLRCVGLGAEAEVGAEVGLEAGMDPVGVELLEEEARGQVAEGDKVAEVDLAAEVEEGS